MVGEDQLWELNGRLLVELKCCRDLRRGRELHSQAAGTGQIRNKYVANSMITMFARCGGMPEARGVFDAMLNRDTVSWNALLQSYVENSSSELAIDLFDKMVSFQGGPIPNARTYAAVLTACGNLVHDHVDSRRKWLEKGRMVHSRALSDGCCDHYVETILINFYSRCGEMVLARAVFDKSSRRNIVFWNSLLQGYVDNGESQLALQLFDALLSGRDGSHANARSYVAALSACSSLALRDRELLGNDVQRKWLEKVKEFHTRASTTSCCDSIIQNLLVDVYGKCGSMESAKDVFDSIKQWNLVAWNSLLHGYADNGENEKALELFDNMEAAGRAPDARTYIAALKACTNLATDEASNMLQKGKALHSSGENNGFCCDVFLGTALINMYGKCRSVTDARSVFEEMNTQDPVSWTALIQVYVDNDESSLALKLIASMDLEGLPLDCRTFQAALTACRSLSDVETGARFHEEAGYTGWILKDLMLVNSLVDFYSSCGRLDAAQQVFDSLAAGHGSVFLWNTLLGGYTQQGFSGKVFQVFEAMKKQGVQPNDITFTHVLTACSDAGLAEKGKHVFNAMKAEFGIIPNLKHYAVVVEMLGQANCIEEALKLVREMPFEPDRAMWCSVLASCLKWNNPAIGKLAYQAFLALPGNHSSAHVLISNVLKDQELMQMQQILD